MADLSPGDGPLERYWKYGKGSAKISWGSPGDWTRCSVALAKHVGPERAKRICSQWHHDMTGMWTGDAAHRKQSGK